MRKNFTVTQTQQVFQRKIRIDFKSMSFIYMWISLKKVTFCTCNHLYRKLWTINIYLFPHYLSNKYETTLANVEKISNLYKIFYAHFPRQIFNIHWYSLYTNYTIFFSYQKNFIHIKKKIGKHWIPLSHSKYRFEFSCEIRKIHGERKTHRMENK